MRDGQASFTDVEYGSRRRVSRRERFLEAMDATIPWDRWVALIEPRYYTDRPGERGRRAKPVETMLRMYLLQAWFSLLDEGVEDAICDFYAMRRFLGLDFAREQVPDAATLLHFRQDNRRQLDGTVDDAVLAVVAGALRAWRLNRREGAAPDMELRIMAPR